MSYKTSIHGQQTTVDLVEAHIKVWARSADAQRGPSEVNLWSLTVTPPSGAALFLGSGRSDQVFTLYTPALEAAGNQRIFSGTTTYRLQASGGGDWRVTLSIKARKAGGDGELEDVASVYANAANYLPAAGIDPPMMGVDDEKLQVLFTKV